MIISIIQKINKESWVIIIIGQGKKRQRRRANIISGGSILLDMIETIGIFEGRPQTRAVLDVAREVTYSGVEDILERISSEKEIADYSEALSYFRISPESTQVGNGIYILFLFFHFYQKERIIYIIFIENTLKFSLVFLNKFYDPFSKVFRYIFGLIFEPPFGSPANHLFLTYSLQLFIIFFLIETKIIFIFLDHPIQEILAVLDGRVALLNFLDIILMDGVDCGECQFPVVFGGEIAEVGGGVVILIGGGIVEHQEFLKVYHEKFFNIFINIISQDIQKPQTYIIAQEIITTLKNIQALSNFTSPPTIINFLFFTNNLNLITMNAKQKQAKIDALLNDSMFRDSEVQQSQGLSRKGGKKVNGEVENQEDGESQGGQQIQSLEESKRTFQKNGSKNDFQEGKNKVKTNTKLEEIKEQQITNNQNIPNQSRRSSQKPKAKTGIYFYPPKQNNNPSPSTQKKQTLPHNYARLQERQKQLLLTTLTEQNKQFKESLRVKDNDYKKLQNMYKVLLQEKSQHAPSVKEITLEKQLATLSSKYQKLQHLTKLQKQKATFKLSKTKETFIPEHRVNEREQELLDIIDKLKERLTSTHHQLKTLQNKMNEGDDYVDQLKRKLKRVEQLEYKMEKMMQQAQNDRDFIDVLKDKNKRLEVEVFEREKEKKNMEEQIKIMRLEQATQTDTAKELAEIRKEKEKLESHLRDITSNLIIRINPYSRQSNHIQDSGQLLKP